MPKDVFVFRAPQPESEWEWSRWLRATEMELGPTPLLLLVRDRFDAMEMPHVELPVALQPLQVGHYPPGGSDSWQAWIEDQIEQWGQQARDVGGITHPAAPPLKFDRPPLVA